MATKDGNIVFANADTTVTQNGQQKILHTPRLDVDGRDKLQRIDLIRGTQVGYIPTINEAHMPKKNKVPPKPGYLYGSSSLFPQDNATPTRQPPRAAGPPRPPQQQKPQQPLLQSKESIAQHGHLPGTSIYLQRYTASINKEEVAKIFTTSLFPTEGQGDARGPTASRPRGPRGATVKSSHRNQRAPAQAARRQAPPQQFASPFPMAREHDWRNNNIETKPKKKKKKKKAPPKKEEPPSWKDDVSDDDSLSL